MARNRKKRKEIERNRNKRKETGRNRKKHEDMGRNGKKQEKKRGEKGRKKQEETGRKGKNRKKRDETGRNRKRKKKKTTNSIDDIIFFLNPTFSGGGADKKIDIQELLYLDRVPSSWDSVGIKQETGHLVSTF